MGLANAITLGRGLLTAALWAVLVAGGTAPPPAAWYAAMGLFGVAAVSDAFDGMVARHRGETSAFGRMADPLVDKLLVLGTMVVLLGIPTVHDVLPAWAVAVMFAREMIVTAVRGIVEAQRIAFGAVVSGKVKMLLQSLAVGATLCHGAGLAFATEPLPVLGAAGGGPWNLTYVLVLAAVAMTVVSGVAYVRRAAGLLRGV